MLFSLLSLLIPSAMAALNVTLEAPEGEVHCPSADEAVSSCTAPSTFTYSVCCGDGMMSCCTRVKQWVWIAGGTLVALVVITIAGCCIRWVYGMRRKSHQSYDFS